MSAALSHCARASAPAPASEAAQAWIAWAAARSAGSSSGRAVSMALAAPRSHLGPVGHVELVDCELDHEPHGLG